MELMDILGEQHQRILDVIKRISIHLSLQELGEDPEVMAELLIDLSGILNIHLILEDRTFYPELNDCKDEKIRSLSASFMNEMGGILNSFQFYLSQWCHARAIQSNPERFIRETQEILELLLKRIYREDNELYPLVKRASIC